MAEDEMTGVGGGKSEPTAKLETFVPVTKMAPFYINLYTPKKTVAHKNTAAKA